MNASRARRGSVLLLILLLLLWFLFRPRFSADETTQVLLELLITRGLCAAVFLITLFERRTPLLPPFCPECRVTPSRSMARRLAPCLPFLLIALNNFPLLPLLRGQTTLTFTPGNMALYLLSTLAVALFEECAFRGIVFPMLLQRLGTSPRGIFLSIAATSGIFGLFHLVNLLEGASPLAVLMQVGYSFLIGGMCTLAMLKTGSLYLPILLHAIYNAGGYLVERFGTGPIWTGEAIALTAALAVPVTAYAVHLLFRITPAEARAVLGAPDA